MPATDSPNTPLGTTFVAQLRPACTLLAALTVLTGILYPLAMTLSARMIFPQASTGSLLLDSQGRVRGSLLIGQPFTGPEWFHGRPSATGSLPYDPTASGGSNLGPTNRALAALVAGRAGEVRGDHPGHAGAIPVDLVTASASGLDPHISPRAAILQVPRVAAARGLPEQRVLGLVRDRVEPAILGIFGRPRVCVLALNLDLESLASDEGVPVPAEGRRSPP
jgi:K+-transporting ATPase ATPase C chain